MTQAEEVVVPSRHYEAMDREGGQLGGFSNRRPNTKGVS